ncbi:MAG: menaquinone biosynthesis decarboxylase [Candidatus Methylacidiphilales bacterium]
MAYESLKSFLDRLQKEHEVRVISDPVSVDLEIAALADREMKKEGGGSALFFERPILMDGSISSFPLLVNAMGSTRRMALALNVEHVDQVADQLQFLLKAKPPSNLHDAWELMRQGVDVIHARPSRVTRAACHEVIHLQKDGGPGLHALPVLKCWPKDGGPFVTLPQVFTEDPVNGARNVGMYRMQVYDAWTTGMHWQMHKVAARHGKHYFETGEKMPVAVVLGGDPVYTFAATAPLPDGLDEVLLSGFLRKKAVPMVACKTQPLNVPANADFVIEGFIDPQEPLRDEGPFGDHTGFYTPIDPYPVFHVTAITHRSDAVYPATVVGKPPMEDYYIGDASVRIFLPVMKMNMPEIVDLTLPAEGVFHNLVVVSIRKQYPYQAYKVANGLWGMGQMMFSKIIVVVDHDVDVHNTSDVLFHVCANIDPQRDTLFTRGPCDSLDHAQSVPNIGSHMAIDATRKLPGEGYHRVWPERCVHDSQMIQKLTKLLR